MATDDDYRLPDDLFRLPQLTYPLTIDTIGKLIATDHTLTVYCNAYGCRRSVEINLVALGRRIGYTHSCLSPALRQHFHCKACRARGGEGKDLSFVMGLVQEERTTLPVTYFTDPAQRASIRRRGYVPRPGERSEDGANGV